MKTIVLFFCLLSLTLFVHAQGIIHGKVVTKAGQPIPGTNLFLEGTYDGASSDSLGYFSFTTSESGKQLLTATFIGYKSWHKEVYPEGSIEVTIIMEESVNALDAVTITAGSFAAADETRASIMEPLDIYTTASANGDVMAAMRTMPGTQAATDDGRLLVRGGDAYETRTYIDGLAAAKPYYSKTPDVATRGRFAPSLFSGVMFSSGGYSAQYGQALSSVLILDSNDLAPEDVTGLSLMTIGGELNRTKRWKNASLSLSGGYMNLGVYDKIFNSSVDWQQPVESISATAVYRYKTKSNGMVKGYLTADWGDLAYNVPDGQPGSLLQIKNSGGTAYSNLSYRDCFSEKSCYKIGVSSTYQNNFTGLGEDKIDTRELHVESRISVVHDLSEGVKLTWGMNETFRTYNQEYAEYQGNRYSTCFTDHLVGAFVESEVKFSKKLAIRPGIRSEYSSVINKWNFAPRFAMALKTGEESQLSGAFGLYHQTPQPNYLKLRTALGFEKSLHYILSYQWGDVRSRLFRGEVYYKTYSNLITYELGDYGLPVNMQNTGNGYAGGIDIFWRDRESIRGFDYWITYSYIDTKRKYEYYPEKVTPGFISNHTFSVVGKYWISKISTQVGFSFTATGGRPYDKPETPEFMDGKTKAYSDLSLNLSHVFYIGNQYSVLYCSVTNLLGNDSVLNYRPSSLADAQGNYTLIPVKRDLKRMIFIGLFLSF
jgi:hypothetical protein